MTIYEQNIELFEHKISESRRLRRIISLARALIFIVAVIVAYKMFETGNVGFIIGFFSLTAIFLTLVRYDFKLSEKINFQSNLLKINLQEIKFLQNNYKNFHSASEYADTSHPFTFDTDIFGKGSVFEYINRTVTVAGKNFLAKMLSEIETDKKIIIKTGNAVDELSENINFRQQFTAQGMADDISSRVGDKDDKYLNELTEWANSGDKAVSHKLTALAAYMFPVIFFIFFIAAIANILPWSIVSLWGFIQLSFVGFFYKNIAKQHALLSKKIEMLSVLQKLIKTVSAINFKSELLKQLSENMQKSVIYLEKLNKTLKAFDTSLNIFAAILLNMSLMWNLQIIIRLEKIKHEISHLLKEWFNSIAQIDALNSIANFNFNNPAYVRPEISDNEFKVKFIDIAHPLMPSEKRVTNNYQLSGTGKVSVITGANMAGKSTFLRTVAVNIILASAGARVCAKEFVYTPLKIYTSMRTSDSLQNNESYFFSELMRLKNITEQLKSEKPVLIIVDEMLRGTNSADKHKGSEAFITKIIKYPVWCLLATHDILLGELQKQYPKNIDNKKFEAEIINDDIYFDYKIKEGISQNLNAVFLMKKYGII